MILSNNDYEVDIRCTLLYARHRKFYRLVELLVLLVVGVKSGARLVQQSSQVPQSIVDQSSP